MQIYALTVLVTFVEYLFLVGLKLCNKDKIKPTTVFLYEFKPELHILVSELVVLKGVFIYAAGR